MQANIPAITSSTIIPSPPWISLSAMLIGQGFTMSKKRNNTKPVSIHNQPVGAAIMVMRYPTISSHTTAPGSSLPNHSADRSQIQTPNIKPIDVKIKYVTNDKFCINKYMGMAAT